VEDERLEKAVIEEPAEAPRSSWVLVAQFFVVPIFIVGLCVGIFILFGLITGESRSARDYLEEIKAGKGNRRWQAAFELSKFLGQQGAQKAEDRLGRDISAAFKAAQDDDPRVRQYLALAMGRLRDRSATPTLVQALESDRSENRLYIVWALGEIGDPAATEPLLALMDTADPDLKKMVVYSLGQLRDARARPGLQAALNDPRIDTRWNAALALARLEDHAGLPVLHQMLDRQYLDGLPEVNDRQKTEAILNAIRAVALLNDPSAHSLLTGLKENDPDVKVRAAAIEALNAIR